MYDSATNLTWEKKDIGTGSRNIDAANLHAVRNIYSWAGQCPITGVYCQPNAAAAATCTAQTGGVLGCGECGGEGICDVDSNLQGAITTVWDWINQVNAEDFAGHSDWRLPSEDGCNSCYVHGPQVSSCSSCVPPCSCFPQSIPHELETILLRPYPCGLSPCIASIFGPTVANVYWSASTLDFFPGPGNVWTVWFFPGSVGHYNESLSYYVRAVRDGL